MMLPHWRNATVKTSLRQLPWQRKSKSGGRSGRALLRSPRACRTLLEAHCLSCFQNIHRVLYLLLLMPVTSAGVERANSAMKLVKSVLLSTKQQDRLNGLLLMYVHKDIHLDYDAIIDKYSTKHPRRMLFMNPLSLSSE